MRELHFGEMLPVQGSAVALGLFDGVHPGHRAVLRAAKNCAKKQGLFAGVFTFAADSVPRKQGSTFQYLYTDVQKFSLLEACGIEAVFSPQFSTLCAYSGQAFCTQVLGQLFHAKAVFCGGDFRFGAKAAWGIDALQQFGEEMGFTVHPIAPVRWDGKKISSTAVREAVNVGDMDLAAKLLGAPYQMRGSVIHGAALGRTHAVPTINIPFASGQLVPRYGVYVSRTYTAQGVFDSVTDVGVKPTVSTLSTPTAETFLLNFSGDLYAQSCTVELLHFLRDEQKFSDVEALYRQIEKDQAACRTWLVENR